MFKIEPVAIPIGARTALYFLKKAGIKSGQSALVYVLQEV